MNYCNIKFYAIEDGVGCRTALFVSGCRHHCKGCFQPQTWDFNFGQKFTEETEQIILNSLNNPYVDGLTLLGGEPFEPENQKELRPFLEKVKNAYPEKSIWSYSGYTFDELIDEKSFCHTEDTLPMLRMLDVLIDGEFVEEKMSKLLPFRGSSNQRVIDLKETFADNNIVHISKYSKRQY